MQTADFRERTERMDRTVQRNYEFRSEKHIFRMLSVQTSGRVAEQLLYAGQNIRRKRFLHIKRLVLEKQCQLHDKNV